jgi:hypothetical protein
MQIFPISDYKDNFTDTGYTKLSISLGRIEKGSNMELITPQAKRVGPNVILQEWDKVFRSNEDLMNDDLLELEQSNRNKFGPRSIAKPWIDIRQSVLDSFNIKSTDCNHLLAKPPSSLNIGKLRPISLENSAKLTKSNTQAGAPTLKKKGEVRQYTLDNWRGLFERNLAMVPAIRTQEQGKTRLVNIVDYSTIMQENRFFVPLFNLLRDEFCFSGFKGPEAVDTAMTQLIRFAVENDQLCISGDIEGFDLSVGTDLQYSAFDEVSGYFQSSFHSEVDELKIRFNTSPLVTPDGVMVGEHGIPSGSNLTSIIGSLVNRQVSQHPPELSQFMGDDFAITAKTVDEVFSKYESCGLTLNKTKTLVKPYSFVYLQKLHHADYMFDGEYKGIYPTYRALNRLCYPERFSDFNDYGLIGKDYFAIRSLSILENCKYHPLFEKFVKFWMRFEKYKVPSNRSIREFVKMNEEKLGSIGTVNQYGDKIRGLRDFESYRLAVRFS